MVTSVRLPEDLERAVLAYAQRHDVSKSTAMRLLMENGLAREGLDRDVTDLEERLSTVEKTLTDVASALERLETSIEDIDAGTPATADGAADSPRTPLQPAGSTTDLAEPEGVTTIAGGPDAVPDGSANDEATEQAPIAEWHDGSRSLEEVTDGGQPTERPSAEQS